MKSFKQFLIERDNRQKIVQIYKLNPAIAEYAHNVNADNSMWVAKVIRDDLIPRYLENKTENAEQIKKALMDTKSTPESEPIVKEFIDKFLSLRDNPNMPFEQFNNIFDWVNGMKQQGGVQLLKNPRAGARPDKAFTFAEALEQADEYHRRLGTGVTMAEDMAMQITNENKKNVIMSFPDGFYWIDLKCKSPNTDTKWGNKNYFKSMAEYMEKNPTANTCSQESVAMGHCGNSASSDTMVSLRKNGVPHVTFAFKRGNNGPFSIYQQGKGKGNSKPSRRYHPYIVDLFIKFQVERYESVVFSDKDFHPSDLRTDLFKKLIEGDPDIMSFPDVPIMAFANKVIPLEEAKKYLHINDFDIDETGVKIKVPKNRMGIMNSMYMFPELAGMKSATNLSVEELESVVGELYSRLKDDAKYQDIFVRPLENIASWHLQPKGYVPKVDKKETFAELLISSAVPGGDPFATKLCESIVNTLISENKALIYPASEEAVAEEIAGEPVHNPDAIPVDITDRAVKSTDGAILALTLKEYVQLVEAGGGNFSISNGYEYLQNYVNKLNKGEVNTQSKAMEEVEALKVVTANMTKIVSSFLERGESKEQMKFDFADEFAPNFEGQAEMIVNGEERS